MRRRDADGPAVDDDADTGIQVRRVALQDAHERPSAHVSAGSPLASTFTHEQGVALLHEERE